MRRDKLRGKKLNNKGMTLVELIVAIAILSIAIVPLMYAFVNVARFSGRARELQQTTAIAHTVMENCKAYPVSEIRNQMNNSLDPTVKKFFDTKFATEGFSVSGYYADGTNPSNKFYIDNVKVDNAIYDVCLELVPYTNSLGIPATEDLMKFEDMNPLLDGVFMAQSTKDVGNTLVASELDEKAYYMAMDAIAGLVNTFTGEAANGYEPTSFTAQEVEDSFKSGGMNAGEFVLDRNIYVNMNASGSDETVTVIYEYEYSITDGAFEFEGKPINTPTPAPGATALPATTTVPRDISAGKVFDITDTDPMTGSKKFIVYSNTTTNDASGYADVALEDLYLFYIPGYESLVMDYPINSDNIYISNSLGREVNVYLLKQKYMGLNDTNLQIAESSYSPSVTGTGSIKLYHNLDKNLQSGFTGSSYSMSGVTEITDLIEVSPTQLMFRVNVSIYRANAFTPDPSNNHTIDTTTHTPVLSMNGTKVDW